MKKMNPALDVTRYGLLAVLFLFLLFPVYWMVITALKTNMEAYLYPPTFFPQLLSIDSFKSLFNENKQFFVYYGNNFVVSAWSAALTALLAIPAGYGLSRFKFKWNVWIIALFLSWQMFPVVSRMISLYGLLGKIHLINTMPGLIPTRFRRQSRMRRWSTVRAGSRPSTGSSYRSSFPAFSPSPSIPFS